MQRTNARTVAAGLTLASIITISTLSFIGIMALVSLPLAILVFFLASFIDGQVYWKNLSKAMQSLAFNNALYLKRNIVRRYLLKFITDSDLDYSNNAFLAAYAKLWKFITRLHQEHEHLTTQQAAELLAAEERLERMEKFFLKNFKSHKLPSKPTVIESAIDALLKNSKLEPELNKLRSELKYRPWILRAGYIFAIGAGISTGLAGISAFYAGVVALGISAAVPGGAIIVIGIISAIAYSFVMYQCIMDMLANDTLRVYWQKMSNYCHDSNNELIVARTLGMIFIATLVIGISIAATVATAGTWWFAAKAGAKYVGNLPDSIANAISHISTVLFAVPTLIFSIFNAFPSTQRMITFLKNIGSECSEVGRSIQEIWENEVTSQEGIANTSLGFLRFINPFHFVSIVLGKILFIGHLISNGASSAQGVPGMPAASNIAFNAVTEGLTDFHYTPKDKKVTSTELRIDDEDHAHHNGLLEKIIFSPVYLCKILATVWDALLTWNLKKSREKIWGEKKLQLLEPTPINLAWQQQEVIEDCEGYVAQHHPSLIMHEPVDEKASESSRSPAKDARLLSQKDNEFNSTHYKAKLLLAISDTIREVSISPHDTLATSPKSFAAPIKQLDNDYLKLSQHRHWLSRKKSPTASQKIADNIFTAFGCSKAG